MIPIHLIFLFGLGITAAVAGYCDARALHHASFIFPDGWFPDVKKVGSSYLLFQGGIVSYWLSVFFMGKLGVSSLLVQTLIWQGILTFCAAIFDGGLADWPWWKFPVLLVVIGGLVSLALPNGK